MNLRLLDVIIDERARDCTWCRLPYYNHPNGCPNLDKRDTCPTKAPKFEDILDPPYYAVVETFDLLHHARLMKSNHAHWSDKQCRNVLYWQGRVRKNLRNKSQNMKCFLEESFGVEFLILEIPEANGVNMFATMAKTGLMLKSNPDTVHKIMIVGKKK